MAAAVARPQLLRQVSGCAACVHTGVVSCQQPAPPGCASEHLQCSSPLYKQPPSSGCATNAATPPSTADVFKCTRLPPPQGVDDVPGALDHLQRRGHKHNDEGAVQRHPLFPPGRSILKTLDLILI